MENDLDLRFNSSPDKVLEIEGGIELRHEALDAECVDKVVCLTIHNRVSGKKVTFMGVCFVRGAMKAKCILDSYPDGLAASSIKDVQITIIPD